MLPINKWKEEYQRVTLGGITCDSHDYYDSEEHINECSYPSLRTGNRFMSAFSIRALPGPDQRLWRDQALPDPFAQAHHRGT
jgi:hypothetical protein